MTRKNKGVFLGMLGTCSYGTNPLFALPLYAAGMDVNSVLFYRYLTAVVLYGLWVHFHKKVSLVMFCLGIVFAMSSLTLFMSYSLIGAGIASTILFVYPIMVAVLMAVFFHERIDLRTVVSIVLMSAGILLFYKTDDGKTLSLYGVVLTLLSALSYAVYMIALKQLKTAKRMHFPTLTFYVMFFGLFVFLFNLRFGLDLQPITSPFTAGCVICLAFFPTIVSLETMTIAIKLIGPTLSAILGALEPVTAVLIGVFVFGESMTVRIAAGIALILTSVLLIVLKKKKKQAA